MVLPSERATEVVKDRQETYGHPAQVYDIVARLWSAYLPGNHNFMAADVGMMLLLLKVGREMNKHNEDNLIDIAGYANVLHMLEGHSS